MGRLLAWILAIFLFLFLLVVFISHIHHKKPTPVVTGPTVLPLPDYANTTAAVSFTTDGIVNGDDMHRQIRITIAQDRRVIEVIQGYSGRVIDSHAFYNTEPAYDVFLRSINNSGFLAKKGKKNKASADERGQCPLGFRYIFNLNSEGQDVSRLWTSSCNVGTWGGNLETVQDLFRDQIPNYFTLTENVNLEATHTQ